MLARSVSVNIDQSSADRDGRFLRDVDWKQTVLVLEEHNGRPGQVPGDVGMFSGGHVCAVSARVGPLLVVVKDAKLSTVRRVE